MYLRFKEDCHDKETGRRYILGDIREFPDKRAAEILAAQDGKYAEEVIVTTVEKEPQETELEKMSKRKLEEMAKKMGVSCAGNKNEIIVRIMEAEAEEKTEGSETDEESETAHEADGAADGE